MGNSLLHAPPGVRRLEKKHQAAEDESCPGEIKLESKGSNDD